MEKVVEINVNRLGKVSEAISIVRKSKSRESALLVSKYYQEKGEHSETIEFLILAGLLEDAFKIADVRFH